MCSELTGAYLNTLRFLRESLFYSIGGRGYNLNSSFYNTRSYTPRIRPGIYPGIRIARNYPSIRSGIHTGRVLYSQSNADIQYGNHLGGMSTYIGSTFEA